MSYTSYDFPGTHMYDSDLREIIYHMEKLTTNMSELDAWKVTHENEYNQLKILVDKLYSGDWSPEFVSTLLSWYEDNIVDIIGEMVKQVFFGLTDDGHFVAYIPESWNDITFGTSGLDDFPAGVEYGHLTLAY